MQLKVIIILKSSINRQSGLVKVRKQLMVSSHLAIILRYLLYAEVGSRSFVILHKTSNFGFIILIMYIGCKQF